MNIKKLSSICCLLLVVFLFSYPIKAQDKMGSITVRLEDTEHNASKENVKLGIVKVADFRNGTFVMHKEFETFDLNGIDTANELDKIAKDMTLSVRQIDNHIVTDKEGMAKIENLEVGVYLVVSIDEAEYETITPCLVSIPTFDEEEMVMKYDIQVHPKHIPTPEPPNPLPTGIEDNMFKYYVISLVFFGIAGILAWKFGKQR